MSDNLEVIVLHLPDTQVTYLSPGTLVAQDFDHIPAPVFLRQGSMPEMIVIPDVNTGPEG